LHFDQLIASLRSFILHRNQEANVGEQPITTPPAIQIIASPPPEDEISLWELWERLWRGKWLVVGSSVVFLALAGLYLATSTTIYQSKAIVQVGMVAGQPLANTSLLAQKVYNNFRPVNTIEAKKQLPRIHSASVEKSDANLLELESYGRSPEEAQSYLHSIVQSLLGHEQDRYEQTLKLHQAQLKELQRQYRALETSSPADTRHTEHSEPSALLLMEQSMRFSAASSLLQQIANAENQLSPANTRPPEVVRQPSYDPVAVSPKKLVVLILALFGGLFVGILVVLLRSSRKSNDDSATT
jgi:uncharacterized protein involved in exopolysaccharide biosynthesis